MTHSTGQFPNETYVNGLRDNPDFTLAVLYNEFRQPVIRAVTHLGGSTADGAVFFQVAVNEAARLAREEALPSGVPILQILTVYATAHYRDWLEQHGQAPPLPEPAGSEEPVIPAFAPGSETLRHTRLKIFAWKKLQTLDEPCRKLLLAAAHAEPADHPGEALRRCTERYLEALSSRNTPTPDLPGWPLVVLRDTAGYHTWQRTQALEQEWSLGKKQNAPDSNRTWQWAIAVFLLVVFGYSTYQYFWQPRTAAEVFADNFAPPPSLIGDLEARYGPEMGNDSSGARLSGCLQLLEEADAYYLGHNYQAAQDPLLLIVLDSTSICQSDAWYYLGIIQLKLDDPTSAIQCFAKIEDLERYGEDLYWYQALAFVQLAKENPLMRERALRAVERTLGNTRDSLRHQQAEKMLNHLSR